MIVSCWHCHRELEFPSGPLPFKSTCDFCSTFLHVCKNCAFYTPGKPNDCFIPETSVADKEHANSCEEFKIVSPSKGLPTTPSPQKVEDRLFGNSYNTYPPKKFNNLFED